MSAHHTREKVKNPQRAAISAHNHREQVKNPPTGRYERAQYLFNQGKGEKSNILPENRSKIQTKVKNGPEEHEHTRN